MTFRVSSLWPVYTRHSLRAAPVSVRSPSSLMTLGCQCWALKANCPIRDLHFYNWPIRGIYFDKLSRHWSNCSWSLWTPEAAPDMWRLNTQVPGYRHPATPASCSPWLASDKVWWRRHSQEALHLGKLEGWVTDHVFGSYLGFEDLGVLGFLGTRAWQKECWKTWISIYVWMRYRAIYQNCVKGCLLDWNEVGYYLCLIKYSNRFKFS